VDFILPIDGFFDTEANFEVCVLSGGLRFICVLLSEKSLGGALGSLLGRLSILEFMGLGRLVRSFLLVLIVHLSRLGIVGGIG